MGYGVVSAVVAGTVAVLVGAYRHAAKRRRRTADERLRVAPVRDLVVEVAAAVDSASWGRLEPGGVLQAAGARTEEDLLQGLDALWAALIADDEAEGRAGRDSNAFEFYDLGLARISEALRARLQRPQPWETAPRR